MVTSRIFFDDVDYICSSALTKEQLPIAQQKGERYWMYDNTVTLRGNNPAYARFKYGYYVWRKGIDGMTSWTFQTTQNACGLPGVVDTIEAEVYLAYPDPRGPLATLHWEAIREGIDDHKLIYQLEKRIEDLKQTDADTNEYTNYLSALRQKKDEPGLNCKNSNGWDPVFFERLRNRLIQLILDAGSKLEGKAGTGIN